MEFLTHIRTTLPASLTDGEREEIVQRERKRSSELADAGHQKRLWREPGRTAAWVLWEARDATELHAVLSSLAFFPYAEIDVIPLAEHPSDPGKTAATQP